MIVEKISLLVPFVDDQYGTYLQKKVTMDIILQEGDTPEKALDYALETVTAWNQSTKKSAQSSVVITELPEIPTEAVIPEHLRVEALIKDIESEKVLRLPNGTGGLLAWKLLVDSVKNQRLTDAYDLRLKELMQ